MKTTARSIQDGHILCVCGGKSLTKLGQGKYFCDECGSEAGEICEGDPAVEIVIE